MTDLETLLAISARGHSHLCPRQILGVRLGLAGMAALGFKEPPVDKSLLVIVETDGCFADGVMAATGCSVGHRTLRVEDYGKIAATLADTKTGRAVRVSPNLDIRERAGQSVSEEPRHYFAQMQAYRVLPNDQLLAVVDVQLSMPLQQIISRPGVRANCAICGEEIINEREVERDGLLLCRACAGDSYYQETVALPSFALDLRSA